MPRREPMGSAVKGENTRTERRSLQAAEKLVRMYPNNGLKTPVRKYKETFSALAVLKTMFFGKESAKSA
jgi:hypothetical protein